MAIAELYTTAPRARDRYGAEELLPEAGVVGSGRAIRLVAVDFDRVPELVAWYEAGSYLAIAAGSSPPPGWGVRMHRVSVGPPTSGGEEVAGVRAGVRGLLAPEDLSIVWRLCASQDLLRRAAGLPGMAIDGPLHGVSLRFATELAATGVLTHARRDGVSFAAEVAAAAGRAVACGENAGVGPGTPEAMVALWGRSPAHRANMLHPGWGRVGGACVEDGQGRRWWVCDYCEP